MHREALAAAGVEGRLDAVGHSMGGMALLAFALAHPDRVKRLALIGTGRGGGTPLRAPGALWNRHHPGFPGLALLGSVHLAIGRLGSERVLNNYIERHSFVDQAHAHPTPFHPAIGYAPEPAEQTGSASPGPWTTGPASPRSSPQPWCCAVGTTRSSRCPAHSSWPPPSPAPGSSWRPQRPLPFIEEPDAFWATVATFLAPPTRTRKGPPRAVDLRMTDRTRPSGRLRARSRRQPGGGRQDRDPEGPRQL